MRRRISERKRLLFGSKLERAGIFLGSWEFGLPECDIYFFGTKLKDYKYQKKKIQMRRLYFKNGISTTKNIIALIRPSKGVAVQVKHAVSKY